MAATNTSGILFRIREVLHAKFTRVGFAGRNLVGKPKMGTGTKVALTIIGLMVLFGFVAPFAIAALEEARYVVSNHFSGGSGWFKAFITTWGLNAWGYVASIYSARLQGLVFTVLGLCGCFALYLILMPRVKAAGKPTSERKTTIFDQAPAIKHGAYGNARIEHKDRALAATTRTWNPEKSLKHAGMVLGYSARLHRYFLSAADAHTYIVASPGSGKTTRFFLPTIYAIMKSKDSAVIFDNKGELYDLTGADARKSGHKVIVIDYVNWRRSQLFNPLTTITSVYDERMTEYERELNAAAEAGANGDKEAEAAHMRAARNARIDAREQATSMAQNVAGAIIPDTQKTDGFWDPSARDLLSAMLLFVCTYHESDWVGEGKAPTAPEPQQRTLHSVLALLDAKGKEYTVMNGMVRESRIELQDLFDGLASDNPASRMFSQARNSTGQTLMSIVSSLVRYLNTLCTESNNMISYESEVDLDAIGEEPTIIYLVASTDQNSKKIMVPVVTTLLYQACVRSAKKNGGCMPCYVHFLMEELGSYETMPGNLLASMISTGRGYGLRVHAVLQSEHQFRLLFGADMANTMQNIFNNVLYLNINEPQVAKNVSASIGDYTITVPAGNSIAEKGVPVVPPSTLEAWDPAWGAFVKRDKNTANTLANKLIYRRGGSFWAMFPNASPAWQPASINLGIDSVEASRAKSRIAEGEDRSAGRALVAPWKAESLTTRAHAELVQGFEVGGVDAQTKADILAAQVEMTLSTGRFYSWEASAQADAICKARFDFAAAPYQGEEQNLDRWVIDRRSLHDKDHEQQRAVTNRLLNTVNEALLAHDGQGVPPASEADKKARTDLRHLWEKTYSQEMKKLAAEQGFSR